MLTWSLITTQDTFNTTAHLSSICSRCVTENDLNCHKSPCNPMVSPSLHHLNGLWKVMGLNPIWDSTFFNIPRLWQLFNTPSLFDDKTSNLSSFFENCSILRCSILSHLFSVFSDDPIPLMWSAGLNTDQYWRRRTSDTTTSSCGSWVKRNWYSL